LITIIKDHFPWLLGGHQACQPTRNLLLTSLGNWLHRRLAWGIWDWANWNWGQNPMAPTTLRSTPTCTTHMAPGQLREDHPTQAIFGMPENRP